MYLLALVNFSKCRCHAEFFDLKNPKDPQPHYIILPNFEQLFLQNIAQYPSSLLSYLSHQHPAFVSLSRPSLRNPSVAVALASFFKPPLPLSLPFASQNLQISTSLPRVPSTALERTEIRIIALCHAPSSDASRLPPDPRKSFPERGVPPPPRITSIKIKVESTKRLNGESMDSSNQLVKALLDHAVQWRQWLGGR